MIKRLFIPLAAAALASCAVTDAGEDRAPAPAPPPAMIGTVAAAVPADCPLTIAFASYGAGIDAPTRARVESLLVGDPTVTAVQAHRWGREGEVTLCVRTRAAADSARLFRQIRALVPPRPRGPISLRTLSGLSYETPPLRR